MPYLVKGSFDRCWFSSAPIARCHRPLHHMVQQLRRDPDLRLATQALRSLVLDRHTDSLALS